MYHLLVAYVFFGRSPPSWPRIASGRFPRRLAGQGSALAPTDRVKKLAIYAHERVSHEWLVDPLARTLEVLRLESGRWMIVATHSGDDVVRAEPLGDIVLDLRALWGDDAG